jgi:ferredoxin
MRLIVDRHRCQGHNRCFAAAEELFELDDELKAVVKRDPVPTDMEEAAVSAVRNCPERAITIE